MKKCGDGCGVYYCSMQCAKKDRPSHKEVCKPCNKKKTRPLARGHINDLAIQMLCSERNNDKDNSAKFRLKLSMEFNVLGLWTDGLRLVSELSTTSLSFKADAMGIMAESHRQLGNLHQALQCLNTAIMYYRQVPGAEDQLKVTNNNKQLLQTRIQHGSAGEVYEPHERYEIDALETALKHAQHYGNKSDIVDIHGFMGLYHRAKGNQTEAIRHFTIAHTTASELKAKEQMWKSLMLLSDTLIKSMHLWEGTKTSLTAIYTDVKTRAIEAIKITKELGDAHGEKIVQSQYNIAIKALVELSHERQELVI
jgi:tetratricopeptide (TPR) repeat protein